MTSLTKQESEIYDRQIRLWGVEAQQRLQASRVLMAGRFGCVSAEISKNLILAGFGATIMDDGLVVPEDLGSNFVLTENGIGKNRALSAHARLQELNPMVSVTTNVNGTSSITSTFITEGKYNVVVLSGPVPKTEMIRVNQICRTVNCSFFYVDMYGFLGVGFSDLGNAFEYRSGSVDKGTEKLIPVKFATIETTLNTSWKDLASRRFGTPSIYYAWNCLMGYMENKGTSTVTIEGNIYIKVFGFLSISSSWFVIIIIIKTNLFFFLQSVLNNNKKNNANTKHTYC